MKLIKYTIASDLPATYKHEAGKALVTSYVHFRTTHWAVAPAFAEFKAATLTLVSSWHPSVKAAFAAETADERDAKLSRVSIEVRKDIRGKLIGLLSNGTSQQELKSKEYVNRDTLDATLDAKTLGKLGVDSKANRALATIATDVSRVMSSLGLACHKSTKGTHAVTQQYVNMAAALLKTPQSARAAGIPVLPTDPKKAVSILRAMCTAIASGKVAGFDNGPKTEVAAK